MVREKWRIPEHYKEVSILLLQANLPSLRARIGISQEEMANIIGVTRQTYYAIESGKRRMMWSAYMALLFFFNSIDSTAEMMRELRVFPTELVMLFNDEISKQDLEDMLN